MREARGGEGHHHLALDVDDVLDLPLDLHVHVPLDDALDLDELLDLHELLHLDDLLDVLVAVDDPLDLDDLLDLDDVLHHLLLDAVGGHHLPRARVEHLPAALAQRRLEPRDLLLEPGWSNATKMTTCAACG